MDIAVKEEYLKTAMALHQAYPVVDAHLDLAGEILIRRNAGEKHIIKTHYLKNWVKAGIKLIVSSVYVSTKIIKQGGEEAAWQDALAQIEALKTDMKGCLEVIPVRNKKELKKVLQENKIGILIYMEGLDCIGSDIGRIEQLYRLGVRGASLTWSRENQLATGCCKASRQRQISGGLTEKGKEAVKELERLSMFIDISHLNDDGFEDLKKIVKRPYLATHSGAKSVYENYRNLTDQQMQELAGAGGIMGVNGCKLIAGSIEGNHLEMLCRHIEYETQTIGEKHVGFGFDLCDSYDAAENKEAGILTEKYDCLLNHGQIPLLTAALLQRGMEKEKLTGIIGGNFIRYFEQVLPL